MRLLQKLLPSCNGRFADWVESLQWDMAEDVSCFLMRVVESKKVGVAKNISGRELREKDIDDKSDSARWFNGGVDSFLCFTFAACYG